MGDRGHNRHGP